MISRAQRYIELCKIVLTNTDDVKLKSTLQQLALNLGCDTVETDVAARVHRLLGSAVSILHACHYFEGD